MADQSSDEECLSVVDCAGLHEIASTGQNLRQLCLDALSCGAIGVPSCVWNEFKDLYEEEAAEIEEFIARKINMKKSYHANAARIADHLNSGFSRGAYDGATDLYTASIASIEGLVVLTAASEVDRYGDMGCKVSDLGSWAEQQS